MRKIDPRYTVYCTAGMLKITVFPNGDVYRCSADYNYGRPPLFNILDDEYPFLDEATPCTHERCDINCDIIDIQKFIFDNENKVFTETLVTEICNKELTRYTLRYINDPNENKFNFIRIVWIPSYKCNFNCYYCNYGDPSKPKERSADPELTTSQWLEFFKKIYTRFDCGDLGIAGGEPMLSDSVLPVVKLMSDKFWCTITTNMSKSFYALTRSNILREEVYKQNSLAPIYRGLSIVGSIHPTARNFNIERLKSSSLLLKNNGYPVMLTLVGHPDQLFLAEEWSEWCKKYNISFFLHRWNGGDHDGHFAGLTEAEERFFQSLTAVVPGIRDVPDRLYDPSNPDDFPNLTPEQRGLLGKLPRRQSTAIVMREWNIEFFNVPSELTFSKDDNPLLSGEFKNLSDLPLLGTNVDNPFKVGGRLFSASTMALCAEYRAPITETVQPGKTFAFQMPLDISSLKEGVYTLTIDIVIEGICWLEQRGVKPHKILLTVTK